MPIHDWTRVDAGLFHAFHQQWISALCAALNTGGLPPGYYALPEQTIKGPIPNVLTLKLSAAAEDLFLEAEVYVPTPLEATYQTTWHVYPATLKRLLTADFTAEDAESAEKAKP